ncbi:MAG TPA: class I SAM-dependent methyltransferase, partial [Gammaproteobacteria bacterium]|nr:class I SAM-dependent methyltransferase [Gammaproteobacteria bacterium]
MSGFSAGWLARREPHDAAARAAALVGLLRTREVMSHRAPEARDAGARAIVDLGAGSGANLRWLAPRLGGEQEWLLVDHDPALLAAAERSILEWASQTGAAALAQSPAHGPGRDGWLDDIVVTGDGFACRARRTRVELAVDLDRIELPERALVTSSALLDLVSAEWLHALVSRCHRASADVYFSLTYDGRTVCTPADETDAEVLELFNRHQGGDKGFGPALGPTAGLRAVDSFVARGYRVASRTSDWRIGPDAAPFQRELLSGWLGAALE